jgi:flagellar hook assembly protein FlgD
MQFTPGNPPKNKAKITWPARFDQDGIYTLRVQAADKSNNKAGSADYTINFEVINKPTITQVLNYPNPFSTSTRFVFVLTGSEIPDVFKIQILTITGKVVREIDKDELGPIRIGRNITEFAWDGTDQFGDRLANGVYLYRVITQLNGQSIELRNSSADQYFTKGFGKMYLFR